MSRRKVYVVEDSPDARAALASLFDLEGYEVAGTASTDFAATEWVTDHGDDWDLAVIDLLLQDGSGFNVLARFAKARGRGRIVVFSGFVTDPVRERCKQLGADAVFLKTDIPKLLEFVRGQAAGGQASL